MKSIYWIVLIVFVTISMSCNKYLERNPLEGPSDVTFFANETELQLALNGCYSALNFHPSDNAPVTLLLDAASEIGWDRNNSPLQQIGKGSHDSNNGFSLTVWRESYRAIGRCNFVLDNMSRLEGKIPDNVFKQARAEARFVRAYVYHNLIELYGDVPLVTQSLTLDAAQVAKSSKEEVANFILAELNEAAENLPSNVTGLNTGRASKGAALAIRARTALYNKKWDEAANSAKAVMDLNVYKLHNNYGQLFTYAGETSTEIIFSLQYLKGIRGHTTPQNFLSRMALGHSNKVPGQTLIDSYECIDGLPIDESPLYNVNSPFDNRDPRLGYTVALPGSNFFNIKFETHKDSLQTWDYSTTPAKRINNIEATHAFATFTGYCWRKYLDLIDKDDRTNSQLNVILMRYAEVLLIYAEAKIEANGIDQSVYDALNQVRQRPTVNMPAVPLGRSQDELRSIVRKERKYELSCEGLRLFDIRRWKIAEQVMNGVFYGRIPRGYLAAAPAIDANGTPDYSNVPNRAEMRVVELRTFNPARDYLWPIPNIDILTNKKLVQNSGY